MKIQIPQPLRPGDVVLLLSPAGVVDECWVEGARKLLMSWGLEVRLAPHTLGQWGRFSASDADRLSDLNQALAAPEVRAIWATRGGYGAIRLVDQLDRKALEADPKWILGYSDITLLHAATNRIGVASIHGPMSQHLATLSKEETTLQLRSLLFDQSQLLRVAVHPMNRLGVVDAPLIGGNLAVLSAIRGASFDFDYRGKILFLEDIGESLYKIERMCYHLQYTGIFSQIAGLILGQFTDVDENGMNASLYEILAPFAAQVSGPVCFNFPVGHVDENYPLMEGGSYHFEVTTSHTVLRLL